MAFGGKTGDSTVLQLLTIDRVGEVQHLMCGDRGTLGIGSGRARQPQEHRRRVAGAFRRVTAAVLQMTGLAGAGVVERSQTVRCLRRGGRRDPELAKQRIAELEALFLGKTNIGGKLRKAVLVDGGDRRAGTAGHGFELFRLGKRGRGAGHGFDTGPVGLGQVIAGGGLRKRFRVPFRFCRRHIPLCPAGHLRLKGGDRCGDLEHTLDLQRHGWILSENIRWLGTTLPP